MACRSCSRSATHTSSTTGRVSHSMLRTPRTHGATRHVPLLWGPSWARGDPERIHCHPPPNAGTNDTRSPPHRCHSRSGPARHRLPHSVGPRSPWSSLQRRGLALSLYSYVAVREAHPVLARPAVGPLRRRAGEPLLSVHQPHRRHRRCLEPCGRPASRRFNSTNKDDLVFPPLLTLWSIPSVISACYLVLTWINTAAGTETIAAASLLPRGGGAASPSTGTIAEESVKEERTVVPALVSGAGPSTDLLDPVTARIG